MGYLMDGKVEYSDFYLHASKEIKAAHDALVANKFQQAYDHCLNAQAEIRLMSGAVKTWIPMEEK
jgi:hypothetical protein